MAWWQNFEEAFISMGLLEGTAVFLALVYVILAAKENSWCWPAAFISTAIYLYMCLISDLLAESALQLFYMLMAIVGWWEWQKKRQPAAETGHAVLKKKERPIIQWPLQQHLYIIGANLLLSGLTGWLLATYTGAANPYLDAFTTIFSLFTTWMVTQKVLENWLYWVVIDAASIFLYASREIFSLTPYLYALYTIIAMVGYLRWRKQYKRQNFA